MGGPTGDQAPGPTTTPANLPAPSYEPQQPPPSYQPPPPYPPPYGSPQPPYGTAPAMTVVPKSPALGVLLSFFIPGVGSMANGSVGRGVLILVGYLVGLLFTIVLIGIPFVIGFWVWGMVDGYQSAQRWNRLHGIVS